MYNTVQNFTFFFLPLSECWLDKHCRNILLHLLSIAAGKNMRAWRMECGGSQGVCYCQTCAAWCMERDSKGSVTARPARLGVWSVTPRCLLLPDLRGLVYVAWLQGVCYCRGGLVYGAWGTPRGVISKPEQCSWPDNCVKCSIYHTWSGMKRSI